ncbi:hypothetical protein [uncultured Paraglaciecola sp.]|uniref:hypothetical protein n=1 Tax=uncultured Paraglaciecola sp. TaxID=1765024 RepID=UPI002610B548|nr:hypothetical protein [uncultured Paraglaciecola sp.]
MPTPYSPDTSTQAMTEVALGLSMAFFALLIVALLSFQMPGSANQSNNQNMALSESESESENVRVKQTSTSSENQDVKFLLFYKGDWYTTDLLPANISNLGEKQKIVLAVDKQESFATVMGLKKQFSQSDVSLTLLTDEWIQTFNNQ